MAEELLDGREIDLLTNAELHLRIRHLATGYHLPEHLESTRPTSGLPCRRCGCLDAQPTGFCPSCWTELEAHHMAPSYVSPNLVKLQRAARGRAVLPLPPELGKILAAATDYRVELSDEGILFRPTDPAAADFIPLPDWAVAERAKAGTAPNGASATGLARGVAMGRPGGAR